MSFVLRTAVPAALFAVSTPLLPAQQAGPPATRPATPGAAPAAAESAGSAYRSAFDGYRGFTDQPVESWRKANDEVGRAGGWKVHAREGQGGAAAAGGHDPAMPAGHGGMAIPVRPSAAATTPAAAASAARPGGHAGHRMP